MTINGEKKGGRRARVLWLERLRALDVLTAVLLQPFYSRVIYYGERGESALARQILAFIRRCKISINISAMSLSLEKDRPDGQTVAYKLDEDTRLYGERFFKEHFSDRSVRMKNAIKCYMSMWLRDMAVFAVIAESKAMPMRDRHHVIRFQRHPMNKTLCRLYRERGFTVKESRGFLNYIMRVARILKLTAIVIKGRVISNRPRSNIVRIRPSIWVEHVHKPIADLSFWKERVDNASFDIVYYLDRADTPVVAEITDAIEKGGALWIDAHLEAVASNINIPSLIALIKDLFRPDGRPFWLVIFDFEYNYWRSAYTACFKKFKVKVLIQHQDTSWIQEVQREAIESAGGIMVGFHWSNYPSRMTPAHLFPFHVFFVWGTMIKDFVPKEDNDCRYLLPSGMWISKNAVDLTEVIKHLKMLEFTFAIFDSGAAYNVRQTPYTLSRFYTLLLDLLEKNTSWGAVVKSRNGDIDNLLTLPGGGGIVRRFRSLMKLNKVFFLDSTLSPATAAAVTNVSVCYGFNSAGIVAGVYGHKAMHWDCSGWTLHPIYDDQRQKILFKTLDDLENAIIMASRGDTSIGDFSKWERKFNYFNDHDGPGRVGEFIEDFMLTVIRTNDATGSLDDAVKKYNERNNICKEKEYAEKN